jgi:hypothetical protein
MSGTGPMMKRIMRKMIFGNPIFLRPYILQRITKTVMQVKNPRQAQIESPIGM